MLERVPEREERDERKAEDQPLAAALGQTVEEALAEFYATYSGPSHQYAIWRRKPKQAVIAGKLRQTSGHLETIDEPPTPDYIGEVWGGGTFMVRVIGPRKDGKGSCFLAGRTFDVVGDPKIPAEKLQQLDAGGPASAVDPVVQRILDQNEADRKRLEERLERERDKNDRIANDPSVWQATVDTVKQTSDQIIGALREQLARRDQELADIRREIHTRPNTDVEMMKLLERRALDDSTRLTEMHRQQMEAERREHEKTLDMVERLHRNEVETIKASASQQLDNVRAGYEQQITLLKATHEQTVVAKDREIARLESEVVKALAEREQASPEAKMEEARRFYESARGLVDSKEGNESGNGVVDKIVSSVGQLAERYVERLATAPAMPVMMRPPFPPRIPIGVAPFPQGVPAAGMPQQPPAVAQPQGATAAPRSAQAAAARPAMPPILKKAIDVAHAKVAAQAAPERPPVARHLDGDATILEFLENALRNGTKPADVARATASMFPKEMLLEVARTPLPLLLKLIEQMQGPDGVLLSSGGRMFVQQLQTAIEQQNG